MMAMVAISAPAGELKEQIGGDVAAGAEHYRRGIADEQDQMLPWASKVNWLTAPSASSVQRGHELVRDLVEAFGDQIESCDLSASPRWKTSSSI